AVALSEGLDRDRAVDEAGNQIGVLGRVGARPLNREEQRRLFIRPDGRLWAVVDGDGDYSITNPQQREQDLFESLRAFYPAYQSPDGRPVQPVSPTIPAPPPAKAPEPVAPEPEPFPEPEPIPLPKSALPTITPRFK